MGAGDAAARDLEGRQAGDVLASEDDPSLVQRIDTVDHVEEGGFACAVRSDDAEDLALLHLEGDLVQGQQAAKRLTDVLHLENHGKYLRRRGDLCRNQPTTPAVTKRT